MKYEKHERTEVIRQAYKVLFRLPEDFLINKWIFRCVFRNKREQRYVRSFFFHESSYVDDVAVIGNGNRFWQFSHIMPETIIGENCNIGQNVVIGPGPGWETAARSRTMYRYTKG